MTIVISRLETFLDASETTDMRRHPTVTHNDNKRLGQHCVNTLHCWKMLKVVRSSFTTTVTINGACRTSPQVQLEFQPDASRSHGRGPSP